MAQSTCILCGKPHATGLQVMGCFICFPCERALLAPQTAAGVTRRRRRLLKLYEVAKQDIVPSSAVM